MENMLTPAFRCHTGVKQGCMLSPTLFNLYLSYLSEALNAKNLNDVELNELPLSCMLYADGLVIFSKSKKTDCRIIWIPSVNTVKKTTCRLTLIKLRC